MQPCLHIMKTQVHAGIHTWWRKSCLYHPQDQAAALLSAFYEETCELYFDSAEVEVCPQCGLPMGCPLQHKAVRCPRLRLNTLTLLGEVLQALRRHLRHAVVIARVWRGLWLENTMGPGGVMLVWTEPRVADTIEAPRGAATWPLFHAAVPSVECMSALRGMVKTSAVALAADVLSLVARHMWARVPWCTQAVRRYVRLPAVSQMGYQGMAGLRRESGHAEASWVPQELLDALLSLDRQLSCAYESDEGGLWISPPQHGADLVNAVCLWPRRPMVLPVATPGSAVPAQLVVLLHSGPVQPTQRQWVHGWRGMALVCELWYAGWSVVVLARKERALQGTIVAEHVRAYLQDLHAAV